MRTTFYVNRGPGAFVLVTLGFVILLAPVIAIVFLPGDDLPKEFSWYALFPILIFGFFTYVLVMSSLKLFTRFTITKNGISIWQPPFHRKVVDKEDIKSLDLLTAEETTQLISKSLKEQDRLAESSDVVGYIRELKTRSPAFKYFTIAPQAKVATVGPKERITFIRVKKTTASILLTLKDGKVFYLTPKDPEGLKGAFDKLVGVP